VMRRVVGNAGTSVYGRMDMDELATPGYATISPATKIKLATMPKGELMIRHPHFTQPVFVRFPRPAVLSGRDGVERFPPQPDLTLDVAVARQLRTMDRSITSNMIKDLIAGRRDEDVLRALHATRRLNPDNVIAYFTAQLGQRVRAEPGVSSSARSTPAIKRVEDPYAP
jgi:uncharacterized protein